MVRGRAFLWGSGAAATVAALWTYRRYRNDLARARERIASGSRVAQTRAGPIEYAETGSGAPMLVIHGAGGGFDQGLVIARQFGLDTLGRRIVAPSRFGYLGTPLPPTGDASPQAQADAHLALLDALGIRGPVPVVGVSAGANSAVELAIRAPDRVSALALVVPDSWQPPTVVGDTYRDIGASRFIRDVVLRSDFLMWAMLKALPRQMRTFVGVPAALQPRMSAKERADADELTRTILPVTLRSEGLRHEQPRRRARPAIEQVQAPTLIIDSEDMETFAGSKNLAERIPHATFVRFSTGGHLLVGHGDEAKRALQDFFAEHAATPAGGRPTLPRPT